MKGRREARSKERPSALRPASALVVTALVGAGCSGAPSPPPPTRTTAPPAKSTPSFAPLAARWVETDLSTVVGPTLPEGTVLLLGGRRALLASDGSVRTEEVPSPEPLTSIVAVPTSSGARILGGGASGIYRFDSTLGRAAPFLRGSNRTFGLGTGPGVLVLLPSDGRPPIGLDVETGQPRSLPSLPPTRIHSIAFKTMKEGAAVLEAVGVVVTRDGGASWHIVADTGRRDALVMSGVRWSGSSLRAFHNALDNEKIASKRANDIDVAGARLIPVGPAQHATSDPKLVRWIRSTALDPLDLAALAGIEAPGGTALVASDGLSARVDLRSGAVLDLDTFDGISNDYYAPCRAARAGDAAWFMCPTPEPPETGASITRPDPHALFRLAIGRPSVKLDAPRLRRDGFADIRASSSGGVMLRRSCARGFDELACARQPNGEWLDVRPPKKPHFDWDASGAGPLADGRVAFVSGHVLDLYPSGRHDQTPEPPGADKLPLSIDAINASGAIERLAEKNVGARPRDLLVVTPIVEGEDGALRFVVRRPARDDDDVSTVVARPSDKSLRLIQIPGAKGALLKGRRGLAWDEDSMMVSHDHGETWDNLPMPPAIQRAMAKDGSVHVVMSDAGAKLMSIDALLLGWGPPAPLPEPRPDLRASPPLAAVPQPPPGSRPKGPKTLSCASIGPAPGAPPPVGSTQAQALLGSGPVKPGLRRSTGASSTVGFAILEREGPDKPDGDFPVWRLRYRDPFAWDGAPRTWEGPEPGEARGYPSLSEAALSEREAVFTISIATPTPKVLVVRVAPGGGPASVVEAPPQDARVLRELTIGPTPQHPVAWLWGSSLFVWRPGEPPRAIASLAHPSRLSLDLSELGSVTVRLNDLTWVVPIPPLEPKAAPPVRPTPDAFARTDLFDLEALAPCAPSAAGARAVRTRDASLAPLRVEVDGARRLFESARYELRVQGSSACVAGLFASVAPDLLHRRVDAAELPYALIRADFMKKRADGVLGGDQPSALRRLRCELKP